MHFRTKSFCGDDEKQLLTDFNQLIGKFLHKQGTYALRPQH